MLPAAIQPIGSVLAALCVFALPFWVLGIPGRPEMDSPYVRGWNAGLLVLFAFPAAWAALKAAGWIIYWRLSGEALTVWQSRLDWLGAAVLLVAALRMAWVMRMLARS